MFLISVGIFELPVQSPDWGWHGEEEYECHIIYRSLFMKVPSQHQGHRGQTRDVIQSPSTDGHIEMNRTTHLVRDFPSRMNDIPAWTVRERSNLRDVGEGGDADALPLHPVGRALIYLQRVLHWSHNTVNYRPVKVPFSSARRHMIYKTFNPTITYHLSISIYQVLKVIF